MKVSFQGFKNAGCMADGSRRIEIIPSELRAVPPHVRLDYHVELTNSNGKHLDEYKDILKKYPNEYNPNTLNITSVKSQYSSGFGYDFYINRKPVEKDTIENIGVLQRIGKLMKTIQKTPQKDIVYDEDYFCSNEMFDSFDSYLRKSLSIDNGINAFYSFAKHSHTEEYVKDGAKAIEKNITEYLA